MIPRSVTRRAGRVVDAQVRRLLRPAERAERPEGAREPGVEHVLVLADRARRRTSGTRSARRRDDEDLPAARSRRPESGGPTRSAGEMHQSRTFSSQSGRSSSSARGGTSRARRAVALIASLGQRPASARTTGPRGRARRRVAAVAVADGVDVLLAPSRAAPLGLAALHEPLRGTRSGPCPSYSPASFGHARRRSSMTITLGRPWRRPISKSFGSWAGVTFTAPVPKAGSTERVGDDRVSRGRPAAAMSVRPTR